MERCAAVVAAAQAVLPKMAGTLVVFPGRAPGKAFRAEVHACYPDGRYLLVDIFQGTMAGSPLIASIRDVPWDVPPCR